MSSRTLDLLSPVPFAGRSVDSLSFREPRMREYAAHGEPVIQTRSADGGWVVVENTDAIFAYARALLPDDLAGILDHVGLADLLRIKEEVLSFFGDARLAGATSQQSSSSSNSDGSTPEPSAT